MKQILKTTLASALLLSLLLSGCCLSEGELLPYQSKAKRWTYVAFGRAPWTKEGEKQPVLWRVLAVNGEKALLLSDKLLFAARIDGARDAFPGWPASELFAYLNGAFLRDTFSPAEQAALLPQDDGGLVSLPEVDDLRNTAYGFINDNTRRAQGTAYAQQNGLQVYWGGRKESPYWTRTPSPNHMNAHRRVMNGGKLGYLNVGEEELGVRPLILVSLKGLTVLSGAGTEEDPYRFDLPEDEAGAGEEPPVSAEETAQAGPDAEAPAAEMPDESPAAPAENAPAGAGQAASLYADRFPALTDEGFLPAGQPAFSYADEEEGLWLYASADLRIEIVRKTDTTVRSKPKRWLEADIYTREGSGEFLRTYYNGGDPRTKKLAETAQIARENNLVFALNTDWYYYRVLRNAKKRVMTVGVVLRGGEVFYDDPPKKASSSIPNRDILAIYSDGDMEVYDFNGAGAEELREKGAWDTLCFGPVLLRDGEVTEQTKAISARQAGNPRSGVGMVEKGHYVAIMVEGRTKLSDGCQLTYLAELFRLKGCRIAFNLDGGGTASMIFMGQYLNENTYSAQNRQQNEVLGIGQMEAP